LQKTKKQLCRSCFFTYIFATGTPKHSPVYASLGRGLFFSILCFGITVFVKTYCAKGKNSRRAHALCKKLSPFFLCNNSRICNMGKNKYTSLAETAKTKGVQPCKEKPNTF